MSEVLLVVVVILLLIAIGLLIVLLLRKVSVDLSPLQNALQGSNKVGDRAEQAVRDEFARNRAESTMVGKQSREELHNALHAFAKMVNENFSALTNATVSNAKTARDETVANLDKVRQEATTGVQKSREEVTIALKTFNESVGKTISDFVTSQHRQLSGVLEQMKTLTESNEKRLDTVRTTLETKLKALQDDNTASLEKMRQTVDEKLQGTLEKRLGESFKLVSERLEAVYKGLGEMQSLAVGVGDLKRVLTNVKARGTWGEVQLEAMLEQVLNPDQYEKNVATKDAGERVEFVIKLPGRGDEKEEIVWLPIDAKFPLEDFQRLQDAHEKGDADLAEAAGKQLEIRIKGCAGDICDKYLNPPKTTDFGILFLPTEGLFAEVIRRPGLPELLQTKCKVVIAGPTTLWSILNSLQMGFRTLTIQKRSSEVWNLLAAVKTEFGKYGEALAAVQKNLQQAANKVEDVGRRSRAIERKLRDVQELPVTSQNVLMLEPVDGEGEAEGKQPWPTDMQESQELDP